MAAPSSNSPSVRGSLVLITVAGCLGMAFQTTVYSPAMTEFFRALGASEFQFGLLSGIPMSMLVMQFAGALITNRLAHRKMPFIVMTILQRALYPLLAFLPLLFPQARGQTLVYVLIAFIGLASAIGHLTIPLWFSWMGDVIPRRRLSSYWGHRHWWQQMVWMLSYVAMGAFTYSVRLPISVVWPAIVSVGCLAGVVDALLFVWVREPANHRMSNAGVAGVLTEPLRHPDFRTFVAFNCVWTACVMFTAGFMQLYALKELGLSVWRVILIWCMAGIGSAAGARAWGRIVDDHGSRPVMVLCVSLKSAVVLVFLLVTREAATPTLLVTFFLDSILNAGLVVAQNGYMLRIAPRENRSTFIAAITGLSGICGGAGALAAGAFLHRLSAFQWEGLGRTWTRYHLLFAIGVVLRWGCILLVRRIREPKSTGTVAVVNAMRGVWPMRVFLFPVGLYRYVSRNMGPGNGDQG